MTHQGDVSDISNGDTTVTTSSLTLAQQFDSAPAGVCCTDCNIFTRQCAGVGVERGEPPCDGCDIIANPADRSRGIQRLTTQRATRSLGPV